jgi:hypothetical protein
MYQDMKGCVENYYAVVKCVEVEKLVCKNALVNIKYKKFIMQW